MTELWPTCFSFCCFFFQAEDGIRDKLVTGVQTCALPICGGVGGGVAGGIRSENPSYHPDRAGIGKSGDVVHDRAEIGVGTRSDKLEALDVEIGRASCRERV